MCVCVCVCVWRGWYYEIKTASEGWGSWRRARGLILPAQTHATSCCPLPVLSDSASRLPSWLIHAFATRVGGRSSVASAPSPASCLCLFCSLSLPFPVMCSAGQHREEGVCVCVCVCVYLYVRPWSLSDSQRLNPEPRCALPKGVSAM